MRQLGQLEGRMDAMEARQNRHETTIAAMFGRIEEKLDGLKTWQDGAQGARRERSVMVGLGGLAIAAASALAGWLGHR